MTAFPLCLKHYPAPRTAVMWESGPIVLQGVLILTPHLQLPCFQIRSHSEVPGLKISTPLQVDTVQPLIGGLHDLSVPQLSDL